MNTLCYVNLKVDDSCVKSCDNVLMNVTRYDGDT